jgi:hypothetical protein
MIFYIRILAVGLLLFNALGAIYGGVLLIADPTGESLHLPTQLLRHSIFQSYLIPGIILVIFNGVFSLIVAFLTILKHRQHPKLIMYQGIILAGWLMVQINILQLVDVLHYIMATVAILLTICGWLLDRFTMVSK